MFIFQSFMGIYIHFRIFLLVKQYNRKLCVKSFIVSSDLVFSLSKTKTEYLKMMLPCSNYQDAACLTTLGKVFVSALSGHRVLFS